jgi:alkylation response protein AidB-like acyl-CoA dehydrogenase
MRLRWTEEQIAFRAEVRAWMHANVPLDMRRATVEGRRLSKATQVAWQKALHGRGWMAPHWPVEHGGTGWDPVRIHIFEDEMAAAGGAPPVPFGVSMVGPVIVRFGTEAQKTRFLPRILSSEDWWCQGFSEPGAGSDLAGLRTRAAPVDGRWVLNGQKTWTTLAQHADMIFVLARTEPDAAKPQQGISFLLVDMRTPGITVRPIVTIDGEHEVNEVFFDDVSVPAENLVGERGQGWTIAKFLLGNERTGIARVGQSKRWLEHLKTIARAEEVDGTKLIDEPRFRAKVAAVETDLMALEITALRMATAGSGDGDGAAGGAGPSILKIRGSEIQQRLTELVMEAVGPAALPFEPDALEPGWNGEPFGPAHAAPAAPHYLGWRKVSIYGGSNEIQRNILARALLGL